MRGNYPKDVDRSRKKSYHSSKRGRKARGGDKYEKRSGKTVILLDSSPSRKRRIHRSHRYSGSSSSDSAYSAEEYNSGSDYSSSDTRITSESEFERSSEGFDGTASREVHEKSSGKLGDARIVTDKYKGIGGSRRFKSSGSRKRSRHTKTKEQECRMVKDVSVDAKDGVVVKVAKSVWMSSDSDEDNKPSDEESPFIEHKKRFDRVQVVRGDTYYRSNLQTTVKEIRELGLSLEQLEYIKFTPFWFLVKAILDDDGGMIHETSRKFESDIRKIMKRFDARRRCFRLGKSFVPISRLDFILLFGLRDGDHEISLSGTSYMVRPWMRRCFPRNFGGSLNNGEPRMTKHYVYLQLLQFSKQASSTHGEDVARLVCVYMLTALFMPNAKTSVSWAVCEYIEEFGDICNYNWSGLIADYLEKQLVNTKNMRIGGCAMFLPFMICEHSDIISHLEGSYFPRFMRWDLAELNKKLCKLDVDTRWEDMNVKVMLKRTESEKLCFRDMVNYTKNMCSPAEHLEAPSQPEYSMGSRTQEILAGPIIRLGAAINSPTMVVQSESVAGNVLHRGTTADNIIDIDCLTRAVEDDEEHPVGQEQTTENLAQQRISHGEFASPQNTGTMEPKECSTPMRKSALSWGLANCISPPSCSLNFGHDSAAEPPSIINEDISADHVIVTGSTPSDIKQGTVPENVKNMKSLDGGSKGPDILILENHISELETIADEKTSRCEELLTELKLTRERNKELDEDNIRLSSEVFMLRVEIGVEHDHLYSLVQKHYNDLQRANNQKAKLAIANEANLLLLQGKTEELQRLRKEWEDEMAELKTNYTIIRQGNSISDKNKTEEIEYLTVNLEHQEAAIADLKITVSRLEHDKLELEHQLLSYTNPTATQVMGNPDTIHIVDLLEKNASLKKEKTNLEVEASDLKVLLSLKDDVIKELQYPDSDCKIPAGAESDDDEEDEDRDLSSTDQPRVYTPGTVARAVKKRTMEASRKAKAIEDDSKTMVIHQHSRKNVELTGIKCRWEKDCIPVRKSSEAVHEILRSNTEELPNGFVYTGSGPFSNVMADDLLKVLHNENITWGVIDCWADLVKRLQQSKDKVFLPTIITSRVWDVFHEERDISEPVRAFVDSQIENAINESGLIVVPINSSATPGDKSPPGGHWVVLKCIILQNTWTYSNPNYTKDGSCDENLKRAITLKQYIEGRMIHYLGVLGKNTPLTNPKRDNADVPELWEGCPQMIQGTLDSGVIVCHIIEKILKRHTPGTINTGTGHQYAISTASNYRVRVVKGLCLPDYFIACG